MRKRTDSLGLGSLGSGALTAVSTLVVMGASALAGVIIARELGITDETDGFFAAYSVFIVIVLVAQAIRLAVLPALARARIDNRLGGELAGYAVALVRSRCRWPLSRSLRRSRSVPCSPAMGRRRHSRLPPTRCA